MSCAAARGDRRGVTLLAPPPRSASQVSRQAQNAFLNQRGWVRGVRELAVLLALYVAYSGTRLFANDTLAPAVDRARTLVDVERVLGLHWEHQVNRLFVDVDVLGLLGSYWYATAHYVVTAGVLVWL